MQSVEFTARDGTRLRGVLVLPAAAPAPLVIYYGGNAEEVTQRSSEVARTYGDAAVLLVNYRGYGQSEGRATESALIADALEIHDWAVRQPGIDGHRIVLHGRSLGTGVAVAVAAARPVRGVVLTSPFGSARDIAVEAYPWLPVRWLLRHPFDSRALA
ncbi:MAG: alpha/beta hydrolase, partial [Bacillota bacterium]